MPRRRQADTGGAGEAKTKGGQENSWRGMETGERERERRQGKGERDKGKAQKEQTATNT